MNECTCNEPAPFWNPYDGYWECDECGDNCDATTPDDQPKVYPEMEWL